REKTAAALQEIHTKIQKDLLYELQETSQKLQQGMKEMHLFYEEMQTELKSFLSGVSEKSRCDVIARESVVSKAIAQEETRAPIPTASDLSSSHSGGGEGGIAQRDWSMVSPLPAVRAFTQEVETDEKGEQNQSSGWESGKETG